MNHNAPPLAFKTAREDATAPQENIAIMTSLTSTLFFPIPFAVEGDELHWEGKGNRKITSRLHATIVWRTL
jgi:hypothetical protein